MPTPPAVPPSGAARLPLFPIPPTSKGFGPSWANSLFEDNAEYGYGMCLAQHPCARAPGRLPLTKSMAGACDKTRSRRSTRGKPTYEDGSASRDATDELIAVLEGAPECPNTPLIQEGSGGEGHSSPRSPSGSSAATAGPMTSASAAWTMSSLPAET